MDDSPGITVTVGLGMIGAQLLFSHAVSFQGNESLGPFSSIAVNVWRKKDNIFVNSFFQHLHNDSAEFFAG